MQILVFMTLMIVGLGLDFLSGPGQIGNYQDIPRQRAQALAMNMVVFEQAAELAVINNPTLDESGNGTVTLSEATPYLPTGYLPLVNWSGVVQNHQMVVSLMPVQVKAVSIVIEPATIADAAYHYLANSPGVGLVEQGTLRSYSAQNSGTVTTAAATTAVPNPSGIWSDRNDPLGPNAYPILSGSAPALAAFPDNTVAIVRAFPVVPEVPPTP